MRPVGEDPPVRRGLLAPSLAAEHPGLWLAWTEVQAVPGPTPPELRVRLRAMADRMRGPQAIALRHRDVPHAYRVFFRHVGLDPDVVRTPAEAVALRRMQQGGLRPRNLVDDAVTVAVMETGVGVWAFDAARLVGTLGLREAAEGEPLGRGDRPLPLPAGRLVIADEAGPLAVLFEPPAPGAAVTKATRRIALVAIAVPNVPDLFVQEALWIAWELLAA
jgi:DNA/RNA-binding domain of Phe-tRNA-synthetase-like protein